MYKIKLFGNVIAGIICLSIAHTASAHFQMIIPSDDMVEQNEARKLDLDVKFWHPYEGHGMHMQKPVQFGVMLKGEKTNLLNSLTPTKFKDMNGDMLDGFKASYLIKKPGDHIFYTEPAPYWEPAEESFIVHYTKVIVNTFGLEEGWDEEVGLKTEIVPLTGPDGKSLGSSVSWLVAAMSSRGEKNALEVEYYNE